MFDKREKRKHSGKAFKATNISVLKLLNYKRKKCWINLCSFIHFVPAFTKRQC